MDVLRSMMTRAFVDDERVSVVVPGFRECLAPNLAITRRGRRLPLLSSHRMRTIGISRNWRVTDQTQEFVYNSATVVRTFLESSVRRFNTVVQRPRQHASRTTRREVLPRPGQNRVQPPPKNNENNDSSV